MFFKRPTYLYHEGQIDKLCKLGMDTIICMNQKCFDEEGIYFHANRRKPLQSIVADIQLHVYCPSL